MTIVPNKQDLGEAKPVKSGFRLDIHDRLVIHGKGPHFCCWCQFGGVGRCRVCFLLVWISGSVSGVGFLCW